MRTTGTCSHHAHAMLLPCSADLCCFHARAPPAHLAPGLMVDAELIKPQKQQRAEEEEEAHAPAPAAAKPPAKQPAAAKPQPKAAAPVIKRLVSAPTATLPRAASASSSALGGEDASRSGVASRAASATGDGGGSTASAAAAAALSRPGSSSSTGAEPQGLTTAAAAARKQLEQQRKAAAALKLDIAAAAGRRSSAAAPACSNSSRSSTAVGGWGKVPRSASTPAAKAAGEEWPALGPVSVPALAVWDHVLMAAAMARWPEFVCGTAAPEDWPVRAACSCHPLRPLSPLVASAGRQPAACSAAAWSATVLGGRLCQLVWRAAAS